MMVIVIDNYDSFTYNLVQIIKKYSPKVLVFRNDEISKQEVLTLNPDFIVLSPGPGKPEDSITTLDILKDKTHDIPILGVCLGHQALAISEGVPVEKSNRVMHGKTSEISHCNAGIFEGVKQFTKIMRYHSLIVNNVPANSPLSITAQTREGEIMGIKHNKLKRTGIQFHPESVLSEDGEIIVRNFLEGKI
ncbi:MAG: aminodeoxychorismate/anthranilate synthase component II [Ignavibacteriaceae bacterium]|nr:aminodeoxychorismate/anthranilate synthase component II [Ignavibacteriaceae bacterium]